MSETSQAQSIDETWVEAVRRLAQLPPIEYDQVREQEAKALGSRPGTLDVEVKKARPTGSGNVDRAGAEVMFPECEPWPDYVDGAGLLNSISKLPRLILFCLSVRQMPSLFGLCIPTLTTRVGFHQF